MKDQKLPKVAFSVLGVMPLLRTNKGLDEGDFGAHERNPRAVVVGADVVREQEWPTYWHEAVHISLAESGVENTLSKQQLEAVCEAMGTYLTAMMRAGMLRVVTPRKQPS